MFEVKEELFNGVVQYLSTRPYREVVVLLANLSRCKKTTTEKTQEKPPAKKEEVESC